MHKGLISGKRKLHEKNMNKTTLVAFIVGHKISGINPQCFTALT